jgi:rod shape-determining protein MreC
MAVATAPGQNTDAVTGPLFAKGPSLGVRLLVLAVLSVALMVVDARFSALQP